MGRKPKLTEAQQDEARQRRAEGATLAELAPAATARARFPGLQQIDHGKAYHTVRHN
jgi:hypothetical protein